MRQINWNFAALFVFCATTIAHGQGTVVMHDNYRNGAFNGGAGFALNNFTPTVGMRFTPTTSGYFETLQLPLYWGNLGVNAAEIALRRDDAGGFPGTQLELFTPTQLPPEIPNPNGSLTFQSSLHPYLSKSENYWLVVSAPPGGSTTWFISLDRTPVPGYRNDFGLGEQLVQWTDVGAYQITGTAVPEPTTFTLFASAILGLVFCARQRNS